MGYILSILSILSILLLTLTIARTFFPSQFFAFAHPPPRLLTYPRVLAFIRRHPRLCAILHNNPDLHHLIHLPLPPPPRPPSLDSSPLGRLAPETIHHIVSFLPPSAAASFASTCLPIRLMTGTQYLTPLRASTNEMIALLEYIAVDLPLDPIYTTPPRLLCLYCQRLVTYSHLCGPTPTPTCQTAWRDCQPYVPPRFRTQIFHTAMAMYRHGRSPWALLDIFKPLSMTTTRHDGGITSQTAWEYRIIRGTLYQRTRLSMILPRSETNYTLTVQPCPHYATYQERMNHMAESMQYHTRNKSAMRACSEMVSCQRCRTVLRVGCRKFRGLGLGLFVTWWIDLGEGRWVIGRREGLGWKDVRYSRKWLTDCFDDSCHGQRYFDFEGLDTAKDRKELLAIARSVVRK